MDISNNIISLLTLTLLEIILGVDNLIFIAATSERLPPHQKKLARKIGLAFAWMTRLGLLASAVWIMGLQKPWFGLLGYTFSGRDILLLLGGLFLLYKGTVEIHGEFETYTHPTHVHVFPKLISTVLQIAVFDLIFSLDSVLTAIGLTQNFTIMATAITIAVIVMLFASEITSQFIQKRPSIRMLAWSFLLLVGVALIADALKFHIPRGYIYFAVCFSLLVEILNGSYRNKTLAKRSKRLKKNKI